MPNWAGVALPEREAICVPQGTSGTCPPLVPVAPVSPEEYYCLLVSRLGGTGGSHARSSKVTRQKGEVMAPSDEYRERSLVMVLLDLARFTSVIAELSLRETTELLDEFYRAADEVVVQGGGRVVKFVGDACLAAFEPSAVLLALEAVDAVGERVANIGVSRGVTLEVGANVHMANVAEVSLASGAVAELVGIGVVHTYRMGGGPGVRISEPVYRKLPSADRTPWRKHQPPAVYRLEAR